MLFSGRQKMRAGSIFLVMFFLLSVITNLGIPVTVFADESSVIFAGTPIVGQSALYLEILNSPGFSKGFDSSKLTAEVYAEGNTSNVIYTCDAKNTSSWSDGGDKEYLWMGLLDASQNKTVPFSSPGNYILKLSYNDLSLTQTDGLAFVVDAPAIQSIDTVIEGNQFINIRGRLLDKLDNSQVTLSILKSDDTPAGITSIKDQTWIYGTGDNSGIWADLNGAFTTPGEYKLTVTDGTIVVNGGPFTVLPGLFVSPKEISTIDSKAADFSLTPTLASPWGLIDGDSVSVKLFAMDRNSEDISLSLTDIARTGDTVTFKTPASGLETGAYEIRLVKNDANNTLLGVARFQVVKPGIGQANFNAAVANGGALTLTENMDLTGDVTISGNLTISASSDITLETGDHKIIVSNGAKLTIENHVTIHGKGADGVIQTDSGEIVVNTGGCVSAGDKNGVALNIKAFDTNTLGKATIDGGTIEATGGNDGIDAMYQKQGAGIVAFGGGVVDIIGTSVITATGDNAVAVSSSHGSTVNIKDTASITANGLNGVGVLVGPGGGANITGGTITGNHVGIEADSSDQAAKAVVDMVNGTVNVNEANGIGVLANAQYEVTVGGTIDQHAIINTPGANGIGISASLGGNVTVVGYAVVNAKSVGIQLLGNNSKTNGILGENAKINVAGDNGTGADVKATGGGGLDIKDNAAINMDGKNSVALDVFGFGNASISDSAAISASGNDSIGIRSRNGSGVDINGTNININVNGIGAVIGIGGYINAADGKITAGTGLYMDVAYEGGSCGLVVSDTFVFNTNSGGTDIYLRGDTIGTTSRATITGNVIIPPNDITVPYGTDFNDLSLPTSLGDINKQLNFAWDTAGYDKATPGTYIINGTVDTEGITNTSIKSIVVGIGVTVLAADYNDLTGYEWAHDAIYALRDASIIFGVNKDQFAPAGNITRAEFAVLLCKAFNLPVDANSKSSFPGDSEFDSNYNWDVPYIEAAKRDFLTTKDSFNPSGKLTKEEFTYSIMKALGFNADNVDTTEAQARYYKDWNYINDVYKPYIAYATKLGFISGDGNGSFLYNHELNRAELAVLTYRALKFNGGTGGSLFTDVKPGDWYYDAVMNLSNRGILPVQPGKFEPFASWKSDVLPMMIANMLGKSITQGYDPMADSDVTKFLPDGDQFLNTRTWGFTRAEIAYTLAKLKSLPVPEDVDATLVDAFADAANITSYRNEIAAVVAAGYTEKGFNKFTTNTGKVIFAPAAGVCRAELVVLLYNSLSTNGSAKNVPGQVFSDVAPTDWYYTGVMNLYNRGIIKGFGDGTFRPYDNLGEGLIGLIYRSTGQTWDNEYPAVENSIVLSYLPGNTYDAGNSDTEETASYVLTKLVGIDVSQVNADDILDKFDDKAEISDSCKNSIAYLVSIGALNGDGNGNLNPKQKLTRAQFAVFYANLLNGVDKSKMMDYQTTINSVKGGV